MGALAKDPNHLVVQFKEASLQLLHSITAVLYSPPWYKIIPTKGLTDFDSALRKVGQLGEVILSQRIDELQKAAKEDSGIADVGFLGQWLAEGKLGRQDMVCIVSDFLAAGVDTVSAHLVHFLQLTLYIHLRDVGHLWSIVCPALIMRTFRACDISLLRAT